jgi:hypothetical protein
MVAVVFSLMGLSCTVRRARVVVLTVTVASLMNSVVLRADVRRNSVSASEEMMNERKFIAMQF